jgi:hypothetical protein
MSQRESHWDDRMLVPVDTKGLRASTSPAREAPKVPSPHVEGYPDIRNHWAGFSGCHSIMERAPPQESYVGL